MFRSLFLSVIFVFCFISAISAQWGWNGGYNNGGGGTEIIERDIITNNNGWGGSTVIEKDEIIENNNGGWGKKLEMYTTNDVVHLSLSGILNLSGVILNLLLVLAIIIRKTPIMRTYTILLLNTVLYNIIASLCNFATTSRVFTVREIGSKVTLFLGPCTLYGRDFCKFTNTISSHMFTHYSILLVCAFIIRLRALRRVTPLGCGRIGTGITCIVVAIPTGFAMVSIAQDKEFLASPAWTDPRFAGYTVSVLTNMVLTDNTYMMLAILISTLLAVITRASLRKGIQNIKNASVRTASIMIARALSFHILLTFLYVFGFLLWFIDLSKIYSSEWIERSSLIISALYSPASALINLCCLRSYREFVYRLVRKVLCHSTELPTATSQASHNTDGRSRADVSVVENE